MLINNKEYRSIWLSEDKKFVQIIDQRYLPFEFKIENIKKVSDMAKAIKDMHLRGAPLIGIAAAYALVLSIKRIETNLKKQFYNAYERLNKTRPTAVNLFFALNLMKNEFEKNVEEKDPYESLLTKAKELHAQDEMFCTKIGRNGLSIFKTKSNVLTHCNTGKLATGGDGTAFSVIKTAHENGLVNFVYADETRPLLQGSRLTAFELNKCGIPFALQSDSSAAILMKQNKVDLVITGADRIALNGDSANKIGTYNLAVISYHHKIPFYIAAPSTTIDKEIATGEEIKIEYRDKSELLSINNTQITSSSFETFTPAFDVTPSHLITGIITEEGVFSFPYNFLR